MNELELRLECIKITGGDLNEAARLVHFVRTGETPWDRAKNQNKDDMEKALREADV